MNADEPLKNVNAIAYDKTLREYLGELQSVLDQGITDVSAQAVQLSVKYKEDAMKRSNFLHERH